MIVWIRKSGLPASYKCDQRARVLTAEESPNMGLRLVVEMCGTEEYLGIHPEHVIGVELTPGVTVRFKNPAIMTTYTNGKLD